MPVRLLECFLWQKRLRLLGFPSSAGIVGDVGLLDPEEPEAVSGSGRGCTVYAWPGDGDTAGGLGRAVGGDGEESDG